MVAGREVYPASRPSARRRAALEAQAARQAAARRLAARHRERLEAAGRQEEARRQAAVLAGLGVERLAAQIRQASGVPPAQLGHQLEAALGPVLEAMAQAADRLGAGLEQALRQVAVPVADLLEVFHRSRLPDLEAGYRWAAQARQVVHPVAGPAQMWAAPLGADPADLSQWVHLGVAEWEVLAVWCGWRIRRRVGLGRSGGG